MNVPFYKGGKGVFSLAIFGILAVGLISPAQDAPDGKGLFNEQCAACHTIGGGALVGPDLKGVMDRQDSEWVKRFILEPDVVLKEGDATALKLKEESNGLDMPNLGLNNAQADALVQFLGGETPSSNPEATHTSTPVKEASAGNAENGRALFMGSKPLSAGGSACVSCHSAGENGPFGGGTLGPDLGKSALLQNPAGLHAALKGLPFPTMRPIFKSRPLSDSEAADLQAFLMASGASSNEDLGNRFILVGALGMVLLLIIFNFAWGGRAKPVRQGLKPVKRARGGKR